jgi:ADP-heptose:LPS heptosyltransferase
VAPAGTWQAKTYPLEAFAAAADRLAQRCVVLVLWGPGEKGLAERMLHAMRAQARLAPETNLDELATVLRRLDLLVTNDSGVKHLAVACGTPTLTLFGPTSPRAWMPDAGPHTALRSRVPCLECNLTRCAHHLCMQTLAPDWVARIALEMLESSTPRAES